MKDVTSNEDDDNYLISKRRGDLKCCGAIWKGTKAVESNNKRIDEQDLSISQLRWRSAVLVRNEMLSRLKRVEEVGVGGVRDLEKDGMPGRRLAEKVDTVKTYTSCICTSYVAWMYDYHSKTIHWLETHHCRVSWSTIWGSPNLFLPFLLSSFSALFLQPQQSSSIDNQ